MFSVLADGFALQAGTTSFPGFLMGRVTGNKVVLMTSLSFACQSNDVKAKISKVFLKPDNFPVVSLVH